ncbi:hypothetical protein [Streptomyces sp. BH055]|uniref:hypothetical protein n=1 Tax=unclassified Streptomyces TaxID=2593676 RepID=UPI003BB7BF34
MNNRYVQWGCAAVLATALVTGCSSHGDPEPGKAEPGDWCAAEGWLDRATWNYAYWQESRAHSPDNVDRALDYGHQLRSQIEDDKQSGKLPGDIDDALLTGWLINLSYVQGDEDTNGATYRNSSIGSYIDKVHSACG